MYSKQNKKDFKDFVSLIKLFVYSCKTGKFKLFLSIEGDTLKQKRKKVNFHHPFMSFDRVHENVTQTKGKDKIGLEGARFLFVG